jgi:hypothetical protein
MQVKFHHNTDMQDCKAHLEYIEPKIKTIIKQGATNCAIPIRETRSRPWCSRAKDPCVHTLRHSITCWLPLHLSLQVTSRHSRTIWQLIHEQDSHSKLSERTVTPHTAFRRYLRAGWTQSQICTAAVPRKKRSLSRRVQPDFLFKGYSSTGAESIVTCSAAVITGQQPQASNKKGYLTN